ncbi:MAG: gliding motility protein GldN [Chitinophagaceae bacterium]|jgi:gliding motility associated protien GldN|nr:gliding motility protein GldN [Chitinophagaceae bacterium]
MKLRFAKYVLLLAAFGLAVNVADAQTRKKTTRKTTAKKTTTKKTNTNVANANLSAAPKDTVQPVVVKKDPLLIDTPRKSLRNDAIIERNLVKERTPLAYEHIREDDAWYRERVWREIDIREKMNLAFRYKADEDNGNQRFVAILLNAIRTGEVSAFDPTIDDRFTTPMPVDKIGSTIAGKCDTTSVIDWAKDPTGSRGYMKDTIICREFNPDDIVKFRIKEEWVFDKESSRMYARILGIAPIKTYVDDATGQILGESPIFWVYYPDLRPILAKYEVYNGKNFGARMSWEELFESRFFSSYIVKSTIENPYDMFIKGYIKDDILRLLEGDNIKDKIFNFEQDLWSY